MARGAYLALRVVEIRGHRDNSISYLLSNIFRRKLLDSLKNHGTDFFRRHFELILPSVKFHLGFPVDLNHLKREVKDVLLKLLFSKQSANQSFRIVDGVVGI